MRILCLDIGQKRIGIAISDETETLARSVAVVERDEGAPLKIRRIADENGAGKIVYGLPVRLDGALSAQTEKTLAYIDELKKTIPLPFIPWDERLTTKEAETVLIMADMSRKKRKKVIDRLAAQIILQDYLESLRPIAPHEEDSPF